MTVPTDWTPDAQHNVHSDVSVWLSEAMRPVHTEGGQFDDCDESSSVPTPPTKKPRHGSEPKKEGEGPAPLPIPAPTSLCEPKKEGEDQPVTLPIPAPISLCDADFSARDGTTPPGEGASPPLEVAPGPTHLDVLYGRGGATNSHRGNVYFRYLCAERRGDYVLSKKAEKKVIAQEIVATVRARGGRFLRRDGAGGAWRDVGDAKATSKTSQALREGLADRMREAVRTAGGATAVLGGGGGTPPPKGRAGTGEGAANVSPLTDHGHGAPSSWEGVPRQGSKPPGYPQSGVSIVSPAPYPRPDGVLLPGWGTSPEPNPDQEGSPERPRHSGHILPGSGTNGHARHVTPPRVPMGRKRQRTGPTGHLHF